MSTQQDQKTNKKKNKIALIGAVLATASMTFLIFLFYPAIIAEIKYILSDKGKDAQIILEGYVVSDSNSGRKIYPVDENFSIIIPKIGANSKVIKNVDPNNSAEYQQKLSEGVAHAKGTSLPNLPGNMFVFAHSSVDFFEANRWNSVFYLLHRIDIGDEIYVVYEKKVYKYKVSETKKVDPTSVEYITGNSPKKQITLMTCWPPGSDWQRLIVVAEQVEE